VCGAPCLPRKCRYGIAFAMSGVTKRTAGAYASAPNRPGLHQRTRPCHTPRPKPLNSRGSVAYPAGPRVGAANRLPKPRPMAPSLRVRTLAPLPSTPSLCSGELAAAPGALHGRPLEKLPPQPLDRLLDEPHPLGEREVVVPQIVDDF